MNPFTFGVATAAYQIEGGVREGGRSPSIWDTFCTLPGRILNGDTGNTACDSYHRWKEDIALIKQLGVDSYRFSISWPRIFPAKGQYNPSGMAFYKNILLELKHQGISAAVTLYHWDLPQWAQDLGGWENRDCVQWFTEYAEKCFTELDSLVDIWITLNEPFCSSFVANLDGKHAPGKHDLETSIKTAHYLLLAHGTAVKAYRASGGKHKIGITLNLAPSYPASSSFADRLACRVHDSFQNKWFLEPVFRGGYPEDMCTLFASRCATSFDFILPDDLKTIKSPVDFLGINFYTRNVVEFDPTALLLHRAAHTSLPKTAIGWDIAPETLTALLRMVRSYTKLPVYITENGCSAMDTVENGAVHDPARTDYILRHLKVIEQANSEGLNVAGYYYWSLLDNFEWAYGYTQRFGLVYVDFNTQKRIPKDSFYAYGRYIAAHNT